MISMLASVIYWFIEFLLILFFLRVIFFILVNFTAEVRTFWGIIIEGSEKYWKAKWKKSHTVYDKIDKYHPVRGWTLAPNLNNKLYYAVTISSNSRGVRGTREKYSHKKVLFLGDSFCFGEGVDNDETIPYFFEKKIKNIQSINLGVHGYGLDQQLLYLKETISLYKPHLIVFIIADDNFKRSFMNFRDFAKPKFDIINNKIVLENVPVPRPEEYNESENLSVFNLALEFVKQLFIYYGFLEKNKRIKICNYLLEQIKELSEKYNSKLVFVQVDDPRHEFFYNNYMNKYLTNYFKTNKIKYLNLKEIYGKKKFIDLFDSLSNHLSTGSNKLVADKLSELVISEGILKSKSP